MQEKSCILIHTAIFSFLMPIRSTGQKLVPVPMDDKFVAIINEAVKKFHYGDRSKLIREAVAEKLERFGMKVPVALTASPS